MSAYSSFAIAGAGLVGTFVANAFLQAKASGTIKDVTILTRSSSKNVKIDGLASKGATIAAVDYDDPSSLSNALHGVDVVISTFGRVALASQQALAEASKAAGVKLFVPSEFGNSTGNPQEGTLAYKVAFREKLKEIDLPYTLIFSGVLMDTGLTPFMGIDLANGKGIAGGDGNTPISWTSMSDVASFLVHVLTTMPPSELEWRAFHIEGERASLNEIYKAYEARTGNKVEVTYRSIPELQKTMKNNPKDIGSMWQCLWALGVGIVGTPEQVSESIRVWPEWNPKKISDVTS
ncbi:NAD-P-binding protein [Stereum hirsutum FP-91666 SS1]|uniref:NAD-P-binding protein n=1 Tax=Stereum hirsutum (strain FP-91666) TaxID=721885 RepID=UPI0004449E4D|nr:NAD-P-binding protein [Stereum hirsutum FP-91666 SS1]EIM81417.1 NAD-P-binding protein [Stereum hirsutum FP-91666 SS1]